MEKDEAKLRLLRLRKDADDLRKEPTANYFEVRKLADSVVEVAERVFGPTSIEAKEARISLLSPEQLGRLENRVRNVRIIQKKAQVTQIVKTPNVSQHEYYAKA